LHGIDLEKLGNHENFSPFVKGTDDLIPRCHTKISTLKFQLSNGIFLRAPFFYINKKTCFFKIPFGICIDVSGNAGIKQPFQPVIHFDFICMGRYDRYE